MFATNVSSLSGYWISLHNLSKRPDPVLEEFDLKATEELRSRCLEVFYKIRHLLAALALSYKEMIEYLIHFKPPTGTNLAHLTNEMKKPLSTLANSQADLDLVIYVISSRNQLIASLQACLNCIEKLQLSHEGFEEKSASQGFIVWAKGALALVATGGGLDSFFEEQLDRLAD